MNMQQEHQQILQLFYSAQAVNIELAEMQARTFGFDLQPIMKKLLDVAEDCGWAVQTANKYEVLAQLLSRRRLELHYIHSLPSGLVLLPHLEELDIEHFTMRMLPDFIGQIQNLRILRCSWGMQCRHLPDSICQLSKLEELYLDDNALEDLPENIGDLQQLRILSLRNNCLTHLPESIGKIQPLKKLYLASNQLQRQLIPTTLTNKTKSNPVVVNALRRVFKW